MLRRLLKYELRSICQTMLPLYGAVLVIGAINAFFHNSSILKENLKNILGIVYIALLIAMITFCLVVAVQRFYHGLLSEEGYLMFTLPVKPWQHIVSKMLSTSLMLIAGAAVTIITLILLFIGAGVDWGEFSSEIGYVFQAAFRQYSYHFFLYATEFILLVLIAMEKQILKIYAAISIGHLFSRYRLIASFIAYALLGTVFSSAWGMIGGVLDLFHLKDLLVEWFSPESYPMSYALHIFFLIGIVWQGIECIVHWFITHTILSKHLNLE